MSLALANRTIPAAPKDTLANLLSRFPFPVAYLQQSHKLPFVVQSILNIMKDEMEASKKAYAQSKFPQEVKNHTKQK